MGIGTESGGVFDRYHGHPYEVVIPCSSIEEANEEKADLHVAAEARAFIRPAGVTLTREEAELVLGWEARISNEWGRPERTAEEQALVARLEAADK